MNPEEFNLAYRAVVAGAPVPALKRSPFTDMPCLLTPGLADMPEGTQWRCPDGLRYEVAIVRGNLMLLPLLSDRSWYGWTLHELERRGVEYSICRSEDKWYVSIFMLKAGTPIRLEGTYKSRESALTYMLEATK